MSEKLAKFSTLLLREINKTYMLEGHSRLLEPEIVKNQAYEMGKELMAQFPNLTISNLEIAVPMCRKRLGKISYSHICKTLESGEYQQEIARIARENKPLEIENRQDIPSALWKSIYPKVHKKYVGELKNDHNTHREIARDDFKRRAYSMHDELIKETDRLERELLGQGYTPEHSYEGDV